MSGRRGPMIKRRAAVVAELSFRDELVVTRKGKDYYGVTGFLIEVSRYPWEGERNSRWNSARVRGTPLVCF